MDLLSFSFAWMCILIGNLTDPKREVRQLAVYPLCASKFQIITFTYLHSCFHLINITQLFMWIKMKLWGFLAFKCNSVCPDLWKQSRHERKNSFKFYTFLHQLCLIARRKNWKPARQGCTILITGQPLKILIYHYCLPLGGHQDFFS